METSADDEENLDAALASRKREVMEVDGRGLVAKQVNLLESSTPPLSAMSPLKEQEKKRPRRSKMLQITLCLDRRPLTRRMTRLNETLSMELPGAS
jgi:hypothetical protein